jgi:hypothetical protein
MAAALGAVALSGMVSCGKKGDVGAASVSVNGQKLTLADVTSVILTITGGSPTAMPAPLVVPLVGGGAQYTGLVSDLPIGTGYVFTASAKNGTTEVYAGVANSVIITKNATATVIIDMNQVAPGVALSNEAPVIDSLTASALLVSQNDTVTIRATAHDPDVGQTQHLQAGWTTTCAGSLSPQVDTTGNDTTDGSSTVVFTAPAADGPCNVTLTVNDASNPASILRTVASLTITVNANAASGNAKIIANLDTYPVISGINATPVPLVKGSASTLTVTANDTDGDHLNYKWAVAPNTVGGGVCVGTFGSDTAASTTFTLDPNSAQTECTFSVIVDDGLYPDGKVKGGVISNHLSLPVSGPGNTAVGAPICGYDYQTSATITSGQVVGIAWQCNQGCAGGTISFSSNPPLAAATPASLGLDPAVFTAAGTYTAAAGAEDGPTITITATATCSSSGLSTNHVFTLVPLNGVCNGQLDGTNCTATANAKDKCVLAASCLAGSCHVDTSKTCDPTGVALCHVNACVSNPNDPQAGQCVVSNQLDTTPCNDGKACTGAGNTDICTAGVCGGAAKICDNTGVDQCKVNACVEPSGSCVAGNKPDTTVCNDHNGCTGTSDGTIDTCTGGVCGGADVVCSPSTYACTSLTDTTHSCAAAICMSPATYANQWVPAFKGMGVGPDGKVWATGSLLAAFDFGGGTVATYGSSDAFLTQINPATGKAPAGTSFTFGDGAGKDQAGLGAAVASSGNVGMIGKFLGEIDFTASNSDGSGASGLPGTAGLDFLQNAGSIPFYAVFDGTSTGAYVTPKKAHMVDVGTGALLSIASNPNVNAFAICGKTSIKVTNWSDSGATKGVIFPVNTATAGGGMDVLVFKVDGTSGAVIWGKQFGGNADQVCESVAVDNNGDVIIAGSYTGTMVLNAGPPVVQLPVQTDTALGLLYVVKLASSNGAVAAYNTWGTAGVTHPYGLTVDGTTGSTAAGNVIVAGSISANVNFAGTAGTVTSLGLTDAFVAKLNPTLTAIWAKSYGDSGNDQAINTVAAASDGTVYIAGPFAGSMGELGIASSSTTSTDGFTARLNGTTGAMTCANVYGDPIGSQSVTTITVARTAAGALADAVMIGGAFTGEMNFGPLSPVIPALDLNTGSPSLSASYMVRLPK